MPEFPHAGTGQTPDPAGPEHPNAAAHIVIANTNGRAAAHIRALTSVLAALDVTVSRPGAAQGWGTDRAGGTTLRLHGPRTTVDAATEHLVSGLLARMEADAAAATAAYAASLREGAAPEDDPARRSALRRAFRASFLGHWGNAYAERLSAARLLVPAARAGQGPAPLGQRVAGVPAQARAAVDRIDAAAFDDARTLSDLAAAARAEYHLQARAAGLDPDANPAAARPTPGPRSRAPLQVGDVEARAARARLPVTLGAVGDRAQVRLLALRPILRTLGVEHARRPQSDRWGAVHLVLDGEPPAIALLHERLAALLDQMERAARRAVADLYAPWLAARQPADHWPWQRPALRRAWLLDYLPAWGEAFAERVASALAHRPGARRAPQHEPKGMHERAPAQARADVDRLDAHTVQAWAFAIGATAPEPDEPAICFAPAPHPSPPTAERAVTIPGPAWRGQARLRALAPILAAHRIEVARTHETSRGQLRAVLVGHPAITGQAAEDIRSLLTLIERAANRAAVRALPARQAPPWRERYLAGWGEAYAARLNGALRGDPRARPASAAPRTGPAGDVDRLDAARFHASAARITAVHGAPRITGASLPEYADVLLVVAPGQYCGAQARTAAIATLARAHHVTVQPLDLLDEDRPWERHHELIRLDGPAALLHALCDALPSLIEHADRAVHAALPAFEAHLDSVAAVRRDPAARGPRRTAWAAAAVRAWAAQYAERLAAASRGDTVRPRTGPSSRPHRIAHAHAAASVESLGPASFAAAARRVRSAESELVTAWLDHLADRHRVPTQPARSSEQERAADREPAGHSARGPAGSVRRERVEVDSKALRW